jgi:hypothetical protein
MVLASLILPLASCILLISPDTPGDHCIIKGATACATCLRDKCQTSIDGCCRDTLCSETSYVSSPTLTTLDQCGEGNAKACASGLSGQGYGAAATVRTCVSQQCSEVCTGGAIAAAWSCDLPRESKNDCAKCVYESCTGALDKCCTDKSCSQGSEISKDVGGCVAADAKACAFMRTKSDNGLEGALRACIVSSCAPVCIGAARPHVTCSLFSGGKSCSCSDSQTSSGPDCSIASVGGNCVRGRGGCGCGAYGCSPGSTSIRTCDCTFGSTSAGTQCNKPAKGRCCLKVSSSGVACACEDFSSPCDTKQYEFDISSCDKSVVAKELTDAKFFLDACSN